MRRLDGAGSHVVGKNTNFGRFYGVVIARCEEARRAFTAQNPSVVTGQHVIWSRLYLSAQEVGIWANIPRRKTQNTQAALIMKAELHYISVFAETNKVRTYAFQPVTSFRAC